MDGETVKQQHAHMQIKFYKCQKLVPMSKQYVRGKAEVQVSLRSTGYLLKEQKEVDRIGGCLLKTQNQEMKKKKGYSISKYSLGGEQN